MRLVLVVLVLTAFPASADWLQTGYDAARTGVTPEAGPSWPDIVFTGQIPITGPASWSQPEPVVVGRHAYLAGSEPITVQGMNTAYRGTVFRLDLGTGEWNPWAEPGIADDIGGTPAGSHFKALASDGRLLFGLQANGQVVALDLADASLRWSWRAGSVEPAIGLGYDTCNQGHLAVAGGAVYVACDVAEHLPTRSDVVVWRLDAQDGTQVWRAAWTELLPERAHVVAAALGEIHTQPAYAEAGDVYEATGIAVQGEFVVVGVMKHLWAHRLVGDFEEYRRVGTQGMYLALQDGPSAGYAWHDVGTLVFLQGEATTTLPANSPPAPTAFPAGVYLELNDLLVERGWDGRTREVPLRDSIFEGDPGSGSALAPGGGVYATTRSGIHRLDDAMATVATWSLPEGTEWGNGAPVRTSNGLVLARYGPMGQTYPASIGSWGGLQALEAYTLRPVWSVGGSVNCTFAVSDGLVVRWCADGTYHVLGTNDASLQPRVHASSRHPAAGELVRVDLRTGPGLLGPATEFRAVWGDGAETEWRTTTRFEHKFTAILDSEARFYARNEAGQVASVALTFHVGQRDPTLRIWNAPLASEYQEMTFFVLGLAATAVLATAGMYRAGRKRRRFSRELHALEADHDRLRGDPTRHEGMLEARRAGIRALYLGRQLEDAHAAFLSARIEELRHASRVAQVDERLGFLPHRMFKALHEVLRDARVTSFEREQFLAAVTRDTQLSAAQKREVRRVVEAWSARDRASL